ncbi:ferrous iron transporter B [Helicobacter sp. 23-1046]
MQTITIALVGQPNVGKSSLINAISGANLKVGNFSGVTVEKAQTSVEYNGYLLEFIDLPGLYAFNEYSLEERVSTEFLHNEKYDVIVNVLDSTNLARNLCLSLQLLDMASQKDKKMVLALNMIDEAQNENLIINDTKLSSEIGCACIGVSAKNNQGTAKLLDSIIEAYHSSAPKGIKYDGTQVPCESKSKERDLSCDVDFQVRIAKAHEIARDCSTRTGIAKSSNIDMILMHKVWGLPIFLFFMWIIFQITFTFGEYPKVWIEDSMDSLANMAKEHITSVELGSLVADGIIAGVGAVLSFLPHILILFFGITMLEATGYMTRVAYLLDGFLKKFGLHGKSFIPLVSGFGCSAPAFMAARTLKSPTDKLLTLFIINFMSCSARLPIYTLFVGILFEAQYAGSALFGIYVFGALVGLIMAKLLKLSFFRGQDEPFVMEIPKYRFPSVRFVALSLYQKAYYFIKKAGTFILLASMLIWFGTSYPKSEALENEYETKIENLKQEAREKGLEITQSLSALDRADSHTMPDEIKSTQEGEIEGYEGCGFTDEVCEQLDELENELESKLLTQSFLGYIGNFIAPAFAPMDFDWRLCVSILNGLVAKEVVISSMGVLYALGDDQDEESERLQEIIRNSISVPSAVAFVLFVMFYNPCLAATVVFNKESGKVRYTILLFIFTTIVAYLFALCGYHITKLLV